MYNTFFIWAMNNESYSNLPDDLKEVIDANSGIEASAWAGRAMDEGECMGRLSATNDSCGLVVFPSPSCCSSMRNFVNRYCYCVDSVVQRGGLLLQARKALQAQCNFSPLFEESEMCPDSIIRISPPPPPIPSPPPTSPEQTVSSPPPLPLCLSWPLLRPVP